MKLFEICPVQYKTADKIMAKYLKLVTHPSRHPTLTDIKAACYWAFCIHAHDGEPAQIHYWTARTTPKEVIVGMFAHKLHHLAGHHNEKSACEAQAIAGFAAQLT